MPSRLVRGYAVVLAQLAAGLSFHGLSQWHAALTLRDLGLHEGRLRHVAYLRLLRMCSAWLLVLRFGGQVDVGHRRRVVEHDLSRRSPWPCHQLPLLLRLITRLSDRRRLTPTVRVNIDVDDGATSLRGDLVLCTWHRRSILPDPVNLNLELVRLPRCSRTCRRATCSLVRQERGLLEVLGGVEVPCKLLLLAGVVSHARHSRSSAGKRF